MNFRLNETIDDIGRATYHVVDGKQRLESILNFADNKYALDKNFGDDRFDGCLLSAKSGLIKVQG